MTSLSLLSDKHFMRDHRERETAVLGFSFSCQRCDLFVKCFTVYIFDFLNTLNMVSLFFISKIMNKLPRLLLVLILNYICVYLTNFISNASDISRLYDITFSITFKYTYYLIAFNISC